MERLNIKGVTLVELLVTLAILGILAIVTVPSVSSWYSGYSLRAAARKIAITLELAKMKAISRNLEHRVEFVGTTFRIARGNLSSGSTNWTAETGYMDLSSSITVAKITFDGNNAEFNPEGTSESGGICLQNSSSPTCSPSTCLPSTCSCTGCYIITLTAATGRVRVQRPTGWIHGQ